MSKAACTYSSRSVDEGRRGNEVCVYVCLHVCVSSCVSACSGEVDCESSLVTHKASAIKAAHFNTLSYGKNTQMGEHSIQARATHTHMFNVTLFGFLFILSLFFVPPPLSFSPGQTHVRAFLRKKHTHSRPSCVLTLPYVGFEVVADAKTRGTSQYQQSTACLLRLTHHGPVVLIIHRTKTDYLLIKYRPI